MYRPVYSPKGRLAFAFLLMFILIMVSCKKDIVSDNIQNQEAPSALAPPSGNHWTQLDGFPNSSTGVDRHISFSMNDKVYVGLRFYNRLWEFDPATGIWNLSQYVFFNFYNYDYDYVFTHGSSVYFLDGTTKSLKEYNMLTNQWTDKADFPGEAIEDFASCNTATKGYIMGGNDGSHPSGLGTAVAENWEYDFAADTWTKKANTPGLSRYSGAAHAIGDKIYYGTGESGLAFVNPFTHQITWSRVYLDDWWEYNSISNTWTKKADFGGGGRHHTRGLVIGGKVYLGMGMDGYYPGDLVSDFWRYDPSSNTWTQMADYPPGTVNPYEFTMVSVKGRGYAIWKQIEEFWKYTPPLSTFPTTN